MACRNYAETGVQNSHCQLLGLQRLEAWASLMEK